MIGYRRSIIHATAVTTTIITSSAGHQPQQQQQQCRTINVRIKQWCQHQRLFEPAVSNAGAVVAPIVASTTATSKTKVESFPAQSSINDRSDRNETNSYRFNKELTTTESSTRVSSRHHHSRPSVYTAILTIFQRYTVLFIVALTRNTTFRTIQTVGKDWYTGYYLRTTLEHVEHQYKKRYDIPSCLRSTTRILLHVIVLLILGHFMEEMVGLNHIPCSYISTSFMSYGSIAGSDIRGAGCHWWCGLLWLIAVTGPGHAIGVAIAIWVPGLRLQFAEEIQQQSQGRPSLKHILARPGRILRYLFDPDQWFREILATRQRRKYNYYYHSATTTTSFDPVRQYALQPFDPDYRLFPATWSSLRILQMIAIAKEMYGTNTIMHTFMHLVLIQQAFNDEWYRVLMCEKRIVWGMIVMIGYTISTISLFWNMIHKPAHIVSSLSILMMTPSVLAVLISLWMNVLVYFERRQRRLSTSDPIQGVIPPQATIQPPIFHFD